MKRLLSLAVAALAFASTAASPAQASGLKIFGMVAYVAPLAKTDQDVNGVTDAVKASKEFGYNVGLELRPNSLLGVELDYLYAKQELKHDTAGLLGETTFQPISATLNLHIPLGMLDFHGGPTAAYVNWGDLKLPSGGGNVKIDAEFGYGVSAGLDFGLTPQLGLTGGLRWLNVQAQPDGSSVPLDVNPLFARVGLALKL